MVSPVSERQSRYWHKDTAHPERERVTITLWPYRSLSASGFRLLMFSLAALMSVIATGFYLAGAWPVIGFLGVEIFIVWFVFRLNYKSGQLVETVEITPIAVEVTQTDWRGRSRSLRLENPWITAELKSTGERTAQLFLRSHSRRFEIGAFMPPVEKKPLAAALNGALERMRRQSAARPV